jgi:hypothetical protein
LGYAVTAVQEHEASGARSAVSLAGGMEYNRVDTLRRRGSIVVGQFDNKVALVTGGASGIGRRRSHLPAPARRSWWPTCPRAARKQFA